DRKRQKEIKNLEKRIAKLDDEKKQLNQQLMNETDPDAAMKLHDQVQEITQQLESAEERWMELSDFS
ncbi:MAG: ABC transporter C-terminal domain-containing protein, partial [Planctomycetota bacterium]